ncbi:MAG: sigma-70 family RNA polymerase sigma factor [Dehalococcoidia bacterium]
MFGRSVHDSRQDVPSVTADDDFAALYDSNFSAVFRYVRSRVPSMAAAEDVTAETFFKVLRSLESRRTASFRAWLFRIAHNEVVNYYRSHRSVRSIDHVGKSDPAAAEELSRVDLRESLWRLVEHLTPAQKNVVTLKFAGELTTREIAEVVGKRESAVKMLLYRALRALRETAEEDGVKFE